MTDHTCMSCAWRRMRVLAGGYPNQHTCKLLGIGLNVRNPARFYCAEWAQRKPEQDATKAQKAR